ncbi:MAG TPA: outer membrane protein assembly factor BamD [Candidatus Acidoferrales bacterium]
MKIAKNERLISNRYLSLISRTIFTLAALALFFVTCPVSHAQVATPQTGGSGEAPPPPPTGADAPAAKPKPAATAKASTTKKGKKKAATPAPKATATADASAEPDKVLYDRAQADLKHGRFTEGRLALQTLINTYPDSEYLAKAKLAVADSYFNEGGTSNLTQAIQEYNDFQTFFPFLDEAAYAQMQIGLAHYHMMEKADRDKTQGEAAEDAFQAFLLKYPTNTLAPKATQYLRDVQEILADGDFKVAYFYYAKLDYRASAARLVELTDRYPLYSENDEALWLLGDVYGHAKILSKSEDDKNHWGDLAAKCYDKIIRDYPMSKHVPESKERLKAMGRPIPEPDPGAYARMKQEQLYQQKHHQVAALKMPMNLIKGNPDFTTAAHSGTPQLNPPNDVVSATDVLRPGAQGPSFTVAAGGAGEGTGAETGTEVVTPEDARTGAGGGDSPAPNVGVEIISTGPGTTPATAPATTPAPPGSTSPETNTPGTTVEPAPTTNAPVASPTAEGSAAAPAAASSATDASAPATTTAHPATTTTPAASADDKPAKLAPADSSEESTSKKKKGIKKIIPW